MTGRAVSAAIHRRLRDALARGEPLTYKQLADEAGCTVRSVRNYLARAQEIFGFGVQRTRGSGHSVMVKAVGVPPPMLADVADQPTPLERALASGLFPALAAEPESSPPLFVALRGMPQFGRHHAAHLQTWLDAAQARPRHAVHVRLANAPRPASDVVLWPLAAVIHQPPGIVLVGVPVEGDGLQSVAMVDLATIDDEPDALTASSAGEDIDPNVDLDAIDVQNLFDLPFGLDQRNAADVPRVDVHVRFAPELGLRLQACVWHPSQRVVLRRDGQLDVRFGPVALATAASWAASFGQSIRVLGDKRLRKTVKKRAFEL